MTKGTKTVRVITSCRILSWPRFISVLPIRLAGTWIRYSNSAIPQEIRAAIHHGFSLRCLRCEYQAKVMKTFDKASRITVCQRTGSPVRTLVIAMSWRSEADDALIGDRRQPGGEAAAAGQREI